MYVYIHIYIVIGDNEADICRYIFIHAIMDTRKQIFIYIYFHDY
jgi:hypothetical protein